MPFREMIDVGTDERETAFINAVEKCTSYLTRKEKKAPRPDVASQE